MVGNQPHTQAQITKNRHTTVFLYRSVAKMSEGAWGGCSGLARRLAEYVDFSLSLLQKVTNAYKRFENVNIFENVSQL